jgi:lysophospholipase L1-like esterase
MKKIFILIIILTAAYFFFQRTPEVKISENAKIVAFGDSLTYGYGSTKGNDYVTILSEKIGRPIVNLGVSGDTTGDALKRIDSVTKLQPGLVIVFLGGNDLLRRVDINNTFLNLDTILKKITENGARVILVAVPGSVFGDPYQNRFKDLAEKYDAIYVPQFLTKLVGNEELMYDEIHPNDAGYIIVAEKIFDAVKRLI